MAAVAAIASTAAGLAWRQKQHIAALHAELEQARRQAQSMADRPVAPPVPAFTVQPLPSPAAPQPEPPDADAEALRARIQELEGWVHERDEVIRSLQAQQAAPPPAPPPQPEGPRNWMEDLRQNDPERYQQFLQSRQEARQRLQDSLVEKSEFLFGRDLASLPPEEQQRYQLMSQLLEETWSLSQAMDTEGLDRDQRREIRSQLMDKLQQLGPLMEAERDQELLALAKASGYNGEQAVQFVQYINEVNDLTSLRPIYQNLWGGRGRGPWGEGRGR